MPHLPDGDLGFGRGVRLSDLRAFAVTVRTGSMNRAATELGVSQSYVSQQIEALERALGHPLLERGQAGIELLPGGKALLPFAEAILDQLDQGRRAVAFHADPGNGEVYVGTSEPFIATGLLRAAMRRLRRQHPRLVVRVSEASAVTLQFDGLRDRSLDVVVSHMPNPDTCADIAAEVLFEDPILAVVGRQSAWTREAGVTLRDLVRAPWVLGTPHTAIRRLVERTIEAAGLPMPEEAGSTHSMELRMQVLADEDAVSSLPASLVRAKAEVWDLQALPIAFGQPVPVVIASLRRRPHPAPVRLFLDHLRAVVAEWSGQAAG